MTQVAHVEVERFVEEFSRRKAEAEEERFVPERRVGRVLDACLGCLLAAVDETDRADVRSGQLTRFDYLHPQLLTTFTSQSISQTDKQVKTLAQG